MESIKKTFFVLMLLNCLFVYSLDTRGLDFRIYPEVNIPVGTSPSMYTIGGGGAVIGQYRLPSAPFLFFRGGLDYSFIPTIVETAVSLVSLSGGAGLQYDILPFLNLSASLSGGIGLGIYSGDTGSSPYIAGTGGISFPITPSFGIEAACGYRHYFSTSMPFYQAVTLRLGTSIRLGKQAAKANIDLPEIRFAPVFPVFYKYYDDHAVGEIVIVNEENAAIKDVRAGFYIHQYMDVPKESTAIREIKKGDTVTIPLYALFTDQLLSITEGTKVTGVISVVYNLNGEEVRFEKAETIRVFDRNAMTWDDDRKAAAFVTAKDPEVLRFAKGIAGMVRSNANKAVNLNFRTGLGIFEALQLHGINYVVDPQTPYTETSGNAATPDYLQFPIQTLHYRAGDCDDLAICYAALLESIGIETAFITVPGHIFMAFSLGMDAGEARKAFNNPGDLIIRDDRAWIPVEITMIQDGFLKAWAKGAKEWRENTSEGKAAFYPVHEAWQAYEPVGIPGNFEKISFPDVDEAEGRYRLTLERFIKREIEDRITRLKDQIAQQGDSPRIRNQMGILYARYGLFEDAVGEFEKTTREKYLPGMINLGNLYFLNKDFTRAARYFHQAEELEPGNPNVLLGIARTEYELENYGTVRTAFEALSRENPSIAEQFSYLVSRNDEGARASEAFSDTIIWAGEAEDE